MTESQEPRPIIFVYGNCQARKLVEAFGYSPEVSNHADVYYVPNFTDRIDLAAGTEVANRANYLAKNAHRAVAVIYQSEFWDPKATSLLQTLPESCRRVPMPALRTTTLWPNYFVDFIARRARPPQRVYPYGDKVIARAVRAGDAPEVAVKSYREMNVSMTTNMARLHELNIGLLRNQEVSTGVLIADLIADQFAARPFFTSPNHPTNDVMRFVADQVLARLGYSQLSPQAGASFEAAPPIGKDMHLPVHPSIAEHFELAFIEPDQRYQYYGDRLTFGEWAIGYAETVCQMSTPEEMST